MCVSTQIYLTSYLTFKILHKYSFKLILSLWSPEYNITSILCMGDFILPLHSTLTNTNFHFTELEARMTRSN